jgi:hypothetical protein
MCWAQFRAISSQSHPVTLIEGMAAQRGFLLTWNKLPRRKLKKKTFFLNANIILIWYFSISKSIGNSLSQKYVSKSAKKCHRVNVAKCQKVASLYLCRCLSSGVDIIRTKYRYLRQSSIHTYLHRSQASKTIFSF